MSRLEARSKKGATPLHWAIAAKQHEIAELLLDRGASPRAKDDNGMTPLHIAVSRGDGPLIDLLERYADLQQPPLEDQHSPSSSPSAFFSPKRQNDHYEREAEKWASLRIGS